MNFRTLWRKRRQIGEYYERSIHELEAKRDKVLSQFDKLAAEHEDKLHVQQIKLHKHIQDCHQILVTGAALYATSPTVAEYIWQGAHNLPRAITFLDYDAITNFEHRISLLELTTKDALDNQSTISTQQRQLQDRLDTNAKMPLPALMPQHVSHPSHAPHHKHIMPQHPRTGSFTTESRKAAATVYQPPMHTPGPVIMPPMSHPATHTLNGGEITYKPSPYVPSSPISAQYIADVELAKKLQAEFDASASSSFSSSSAPQPKSRPQKDLEEHLEQHYEDEEAKRKPSKKPTDKNEAKASFFAKLFGPD